MSLPGLTSINFSNNNISALKPLENLINVTLLDLSNNAILDDSSYLDETGQAVSYKNLSIIAKLNSNNSGALTSIYLSGNNIVDWSFVKNLSWTNSSF